ncbi:sporulation protein YqfD [Bacillus sp. Marseille-P3661]|uniref:sporulation protein YqfD n=1 Tax=Bacillus sp. Marseille-P3661 TaxID=1936234 RepID=UPI000C840DD2|nr:sporulation protein YqfD [Bacillus sp. Marseille-P3661]
MKNQWTKYFSGYVKIKVTGILIEPFLNQCAREDVIIWNIKKQGTNTVIGYLPLEEVHKLRKIIRKSDCKLEFIGREGFPFFIKRMIKNSGFVIGLIFAFLIMFILSNIVWNINVTGANPEIEYELRQELTEMGIKRGKFLFFLPNTDDIQMQLTEKVSSVTWVGVRLTGTTYNLEVVEKKVAEEPELLSPRHLIAKKKAVIYDYFVEQGQPIIKINDFVKEGQILVSGIIGKEGKTEIVPSKGKVFGEIWYKSQVVVPLETVFSVYTGESKTKHYLNILGYSIPVWGFGKVSFNQYETEIRDHQLKFLKWQLPVIYNQQIVREETEHIRKYDLETAVSVGKEIGRKELRAKLGDEAIIKGENVLHQVEENGKVKLTIHYQVIEDIASPQPIIQGD